MLHLGWGGQAYQNVTFLKVVFKIHFWPFWVILVKKILGEKSGAGPILSHFWPIFGFWKFLQVFDISGGQKTLFFKKCPNNGLVSEKKYIEKFFIVGGGVRPKYEKFHTFIFFLNEGFPYVGYKILTRDKHEIFWFIWQYIDEHNEYNSFLPYPSVG